MGLCSPGRDAGWLSTITAFVGVMTVQLVVSVAAQSDHKEPRKVLCYHSLTGSRTIYDYEINDVHNKTPVDWSNYVGNVVLVVNVASF